MTTPDKSLDELRWAYEAAVYKSTVLVSEQAREAVDAAFGALIASARQEGVEEQVGRGRAHGIDSFTFRFGDGYCSVTLEAGGWPCVEDWRGDTPLDALTSAIDAALEVCPHCGKPVEADHD